MRAIGLTGRQEKIIDLVKTEGPISGEQIADRMGVTRAALRPDMAVLVMTGLIDARPKVGYFYTGRTAKAAVAEEMAAILVRDVQSVPAAVVSGTSAYDTAVTMFLEDAGTVFVVEPGGILAGAVSRKDLLKAAMTGGDFHKLPVQVLMTPLPKLVVTEPEETALEAAKKIVFHEIDSLPVVRPLTVNGHKACELVGRFTKTNITRLFVELGEGKRR